jgi:hypothetical protein
MIDSYDFGTIVVGGKEYTSDVIITRESIFSDWWRKRGHELCISDIKETIIKETPDTVVIGKGKFGLMKILAETEEFLRKRGITIHASNTDEAVKVFNSFREKNVVGFFHLTC